MDLYICEKPSQARDLAAVLGVSGKADGYIHGGNRCITWAYGHLLEQFMPEDYDESLKQWRLETLPIIPSQWKYNVKKSGIKQYKIIKELIEKASTIYIATDYDREGESIARELLERVRYNGPIKRVCLSALDPSSIRTALQNTKDGKETLPLYFEALGRQRADWLVGMNFSRLYSVVSRQHGANTVFHIGRVITPTVMLVCDRDQEIKNFKPSPFHLLDIQVGVQNGNFLARWLPGEAYSDEHGRCINKPYAEQAARAVHGQAASIVKSESKKSQESAPLPFDQTSLQQYANNKWGYTADQVLEAAQSLYETHKALTYPRTDCRYLPEATHADGALKLKALADSDSAIAGVIAGSDPTLKGRAFNDKKVEPPHDGIVPTGMIVDVTKMTEVEYNVYDAVRRRYIAQFYQPAEFYKTHIVVECNGHQFEAKGKTPLKPGWQVLYGQDVETTEDSGSDSDLADLELYQDKLPVVSQGEPARVGDARITDKMTRPPAHFTEATLLGAMKNIARFVKEPQFKKILKETSGLGTSATRAGIIKGAVDKGYLKRSNKTLIATDKSYTLQNILPDIIKSPGMTAAWEQELNAIGNGALSVTQFSNKITQWLSSSVQLITQHFASMDAQSSSVFDSLKDVTLACPKCGSEGLRRVKGKFGFFWPCKTCNTNFKDVSGKPVDPVAEISNNPKCPTCGSGTRLVVPKGKKTDGTKKSKFYSCINFPECKGSVAHPGSQKKKRNV